MKSELTLNDAVSKIYGKSLIVSSNQISQWQLFTPYTVVGSKEIILLRLLQVPSYLYTSQQICNNIIVKYKDILHNVRFIFVERCFQNTYYLLLSQSNITSINSLIQIKKLVNQKIDDLFIINYLQFINNQKIKNMIFNQNQIGINSKNQFIITNYFLYFQNYQEINHRYVDDDINYTYQHSNNSIQNVLAKMILLQTQKINIQGLYYVVQNKYGDNMRRVVQKCMEPQFNLSQIATMVTQIKANRADLSQSYIATITDTYDDKENIQKMSQNFRSESCVTVGDLSFRKLIKNKKQRSLKRKKIIAFIVVFVLLLFGTVAITLNYLRPRPLICQESQYLDSTLKKCLNCDTTCQRCSGSQNTQCLSCRGLQYLIMKDVADKTGRCSKDCHGIVIKTKICIDKH